MDKKKNTLYGTSLSHCLQDDSIDGVGPIQKRRARLNNLQAVRDDQGRKRFHGAFTGGFSAGYFNTVDTKEGFQPRSFVSRRSDNESQSKFIHRPEDYMDDEDFGEFGIAPKKVRLASSYSSGKEAFFNPTSHSNNPPDLANLLKPNTSIGEKILKRLLGTTCRSIPTTVSPTLGHYIINEKHDFHGLGYSPLISNERSRAEKPTSARPLEAVFKDGKKLKISGTAFGSGLNDEDDLKDDDYAYNYDDKSNYDFSKTKRKCQDSNARTSEFQDDPYALSNFIIYRQLDKLGPNDVRKYPLPQIDKDWQMPCRMNDLFDSMAIVGQSKERSTTDALSTTSSQLLSNKFTSSTSKDNASVLMTTDVLGKKSGLLLYSDLRVERVRCDQSANPKSSSTATLAEPTLSREEFEWRPCSLLCRHFNVPNPFPDNSFFGTKHVDFSCDITAQADRKTEAEVDDLTLEELRQSIFNAFDDDDDAEDPEQEQDTFEEDYPQVVVLDEELVGLSEKPPDKQVQTGVCVDEDPDIEVLGVPTKQEPVVITLSSSDSSRASSPNHSDIEGAPATTRYRSSESDRRESREKLKDVNNDGDDDDDDDEDAYGPPLPPSLRTLHNTDASYRCSRSSSSSQSRLRQNRRREPRHTGRREEEQAAQW